MKEVVGSPGIKTGLILRLWQCGFAAASIALMVSAPSFSTYTAFWSEDAGYDVGARVLELLCHREKPYCSVSGKNNNQLMVVELQSERVIRSRRVAEVLASIDRGLFVPTGAPAYVDSPLSIGYNATILAPHMHATCLELLEDHLQPGMHALDVGSGYCTFSVPIAN